MLPKQYRAVSGSRKQLLNFCSTLSPDHFVKPIENFGHASIRNLLVHISNASLYWLTEFALKQEYASVKSQEITSVTEISERFQQVDQAMDDFLAAYPDPDFLLTGWVKWVKKDISVSVLDLFTHVITHEFHHKGQILSMSRHLGYTPVDTDVVRF